MKVMEALLTAASVALIFITPASAESDYHLEISETYFVDPLSNEIVYKVDIWDITSHEASCLYGNNICKLGLELSSTGYRFEVIQCKDGEYIMIYLDGEAECKTLLPE